jgi:hypothetical protein
VPALTSSWSLTWGYGLNRYSLFMLIYVSPKRVFSLFFVLVRLSFWSERRKKFSRLWERLQNCKDCLLSIMSAHFVKTMFGIPSGTSALKGFNLASALLVCSLDIGSTLQMGDDRVVGEAAFVLFGFSGKKVFFLFPCLNLLVVALCCLCMSALGFLSCCSCLEGL